MNKKLLRDIMVLKLKVVDKILDRIPAISDSTARKYYQDFMCIVNEATGDYIKEAKTYTKSKEEKSMKKIDIQ